VGLAGKQHVGRGVTAIYHIPFPINVLAKTLEKLLGPRANVPIRQAIGIFRRLEALPTRFLTGRYIALRVIRK